MIENLLNFYIPIIWGFILFNKKPIKLAIFLPAFQYLKFGVSIGFTVIYAVDFFYLFMVVYIVSRLAQNKFRLPHEIGGKLILIYTTIFIIHILIGSNDDTPRALYEYIFLFITFLFYINVISKENWIDAIQYFIIGKLIIVLYSLIYLFFPDVFPLAYQTTFGIVKTDQFLRIGLLQQASFVFLFALIFLKGYKRVFSLSILLFLVLISGSRTHLAICLGVGAYYFIAGLYVKKRIQLFVQSLVLVFILIIGIRYIFNNPTFQRITYRYFLLFEDPLKAGGARERYFENSWQKTKDNIIFGNKIYNNRTIGKRYTNDWVVALTGRTHNVYLAILYAYGIVGFIPVILMVLLYLVYSAKGFRIGDRSYLLYLHIVLLASIIEGFSAGVYYSYIADPLIISLIMFSKYRSLEVKQDYHFNRPLSHGVPILTND